jgi:predicted MFS family arabinose efflux permease
MQLMITYGLWLGDRYGLDASQLGIVALVLGLFDLSASVSVSLFTDTYGKRRSVLLGTAGSFVGYLLLPFLNVGLIPAVLGIGIARGFFEFAIVSNFPLLSEQVPDQRGKLMTLSAAISLTAVTAANFVAPSLYTQFGVTGVALMSALSAGLALRILQTRVREILVD